MTNYEALKFFETHFPDDTSLALKHLTKFSGKPFSVPPYHWRVVSKDFSSGKASTSDLEKIIVNSGQKPYHDDPSPDPVPTPIPQPRVEHPATKELRIRTDVNLPLVLEKTSVIATNSALQNNGSLTASSTPLRPTDVVFTSEVAAALRDGLANATTRIQSGMVSANARALATLDTPKYKDQNLRTLIRSGITTFSHHMNLLGQTNIYLPSHPVRLLRLEMHSLDSRINTPFLSDTLRANPLPFERVLYPLVEAQYSAGCIGIEVQGYQGFGFRASRFADETNGSIQFYDSMEANLDGLIGYDNGVKLDAMNAGDLGRIAISLIQLVRHSSVYPRFLYMRSGSSRLSEEQKAKIANGGDVVSNELATFGDEGLLLSRRPAAAENPFPNLTGDVATDLNLLRHPAYPEMFHHYSRIESVRRDCDVPGLEQLGVGQGIPPVIVGNAKMSESICVNTDAALEYVNSIFRSHLVDSQVNYRALNDLFNTFRITRDLIHGDAHNITLYKTYVTPFADIPIDLAFTYYPNEIGYFNAYRFMFLYFNHIKLSVLTELFQYGVALPLEWFKMDVAEIFSVQNTIGFPAAANNPIVSAALQAITQAYATSFDAESIIEQIVIDVYSPWTNYSIKQCLEDLPPSNDPTIFFVQLCATMITLVMSPHHFEWNQHRRAKLIYRFLDVFFPQELAMFHELNPPALINGQVCNEFYSQEVFRLNVTITNIALLNDNVRLGDNRAYGHAVLLNPEKVSVFNSVRTLLLRLVDLRELHRIDQGGYVYVAREYWLPGRIYSPYNDCFMKHVSPLAWQITAAYNLSVRYAKVRENTFRYRGAVSEGWGETLDAVKMTFMGFCGWFHCSYAPAYHYIVTHPLVWWNLRPVNWQMTYGLRERPGSPYQHSGGFNKAKPSVFLTSMTELRMLTIKEHLGVLLLMRYRDQPWRHGYDTGEEVNVDYFHSLYNAVLPENVVAQWAVFLMTCATQGESLGLATEMTGGNLIRQPELRLLLQEYLRTQSLTVLSFNVIQAAFLYNTSFERDLFQRAAFANSILASPDNRIFSPQFIVCNYMDHHNGSALDYIPMIRPYVRECFNVLSDQLFSSTYGIFPLNVGIAYSTVPVLQYDFTLVAPPAQFEVVLPKFPGIPFIDPLTGNHGIRITFFYRRLGRNPCTINEYNRFSFTQPGTYAGWQVLIITDIEDFVCQWNGLRLGFPSFTYRRYFRYPSAVKKNIMMLANRLQGSIWFYDVNYFFKYTFILPSIQESSIMSEDHQFESLFLSNAFDSLGSVPLINVWSNQFFRFREYRQAGRKPILPIRVLDPQLVFVNWEATVDPRPTRSRMNDLFPRLLPTTFHECGKVIGPLGILDAYATYPHALRSWHRLYYMIPSSALCSISTVTE